MPGGDAPCRDCCAGACLECRRDQGVRSRVPGRHHGRLHERARRAQPEGRAAAGARRPDDREHGPDGRRRRRAVALEGRTDALQDLHRRSGERPGRAAGARQGAGPRHAGGDPPEGSTAARFSRSNSSTRAASRRRRSSCSPRRAACSPKTCRPTSASRARSCSAPPTPTSTRSRATAARSARLPTTACATRTATRPSTTRRRAGA